MPEPNKIQPAEEPAATVPDETGAPEPSLIKLPDGREVPPDKVVEALKLLETKPEWERSLHEKGERYNTQLRELADRGADTQALKDELTAIKEQIANAPKAEIDWEHEDDPDKKTTKFYQSISNTLNRFGDRIGKIEQGRQVDIKTQKDRETLQYWDNVYTNACSSSQIADNPKANTFINSYVKGKMVEAGGANWDARKIGERAKEAKDYIVSTKQEGVNEWSKKKVKEKDNKTPSGAGVAPAPVAGKKVKAGMSVQQQVDMMANDPNLQ